MDESQDQWEQEEEKEEETHEEVEQNRTTHKSRKRASSETIEGKLLRGSLKSCKRNKQSRPQIEQAKQDFWVGQEEVDELWKEPALEMEKGILNKWRTEGKEKGEERAQAPAMEALHL